MPTYTFAFRDGSVHRSSTTLELNDRQAAWSEVVRTAGELLKDEDGALTPGSDWRLEVTDGSPKPIFIVRIVTEAN